MTLALAALLLAPAAHAAPAPPARVLSVSSGALTVGGRAVSVGAELPAGAELRLGGGEAVLELPEAGRVLLKGPARLTLGAERLSLTEGGLLSVLDRLKGRFAVATPAAVAAVRGTVFYIEARGPDSTYLCLCHGKLTVRGGKGVRYRYTFSAAHHTAFLFSRGGRREKRAKAPMEHHTDAEIALLTSLGAKGR